VLTLRGVFEAIFADAGESMETHLKLIPANVLARHAWSSHEHLDLYADLRASADAIGAFAGRSEAQGFLRFAAQAHRIYATLENSFMRASRPGPLDLVRRAGLRGFRNLWHIQPFSNLFHATGQFFKDERLRQLFGRYATYCGSSPFQSPATLMLIAHVEQSGVWYLEGGMYRLAEALAALAQRHGAGFRYGAEVARIHLERGRVSAVELAGGERIGVDAILCNADCSALSQGFFGTAVRDCVPPTPVRSRSLSALTWNMVARAEGFALARHSVFFSANYAAEFDDLFRRRRLPEEPSVYVCAQDRTDGPVAPMDGAERLLCLVNAPPTGDLHEFEPEEIERCEKTAFGLLTRCGLIVHRAQEATQVTSPSDFHRLFPATSGALYGPATHGWRASFTRPGSRSRIPGLYLAGGSVHPGPGLPMAATSGRLAAACITADLSSAARYRKAAIAGGTSMR
jgi:1-hydroxycarotenoid 3,4-desaturase